MHVRSFFMGHSSAAGAAWPTQLTPNRTAPAAASESPPLDKRELTRRLGVENFKRLTRAERRSIRYTQLQLSLLNRRKKRVVGGWVSLEVDKSVRASIEAHMRRSK